MGTIREIPISQPSSDDGPKDLHDYFTIEKKKFRYLPGVRSSLNCPGCAGGVTKRWLHLCDGIVIPLCLWCAWRLNEIEPLYIDFLEQLKKRIDCKTPILYDAENKLIITFNTNEKASSSFNKASITDCAPNHTNETSANQDPNTSVSSLLPATQVTSPCQGTSVSPYRPAIPSYLSVFRRISREVDNSTAIQNSELANNLNKREFYGNVDALDWIDDRMETEEADGRAHEMIERSDSYIYSDFDDCRFKYHEEEVTPTVCVGCCYGKKKTKRYLILTGGCLVAFCTWCTWCLNYKYSEYISELLRIVEEKYEKPIFLDPMNQRITYAAIREKGRTMYRSYNRIKNLQRSEPSRLEDELNDNHENDIENLTDGSNSAETDSDEEDDDEGGFKPFYLY